MSPTTQTPPVLTSAGRQDLQRRLDAALAALADVEQRMKDGERGEEETEGRRRLLEQVDTLTTALSRAADVADVVEDPTIVEVGDEVVVQDDTGGVETFALVHPVEATGDDTRISSASPLGSALLGARPGDRVLVQAPGGAYGLTIQSRRRLS